MDRVELICVAIGVGVIVVAIVVAVFWRPFASIKPSDGNSSQNYDSGVGP